MILEEDKKVLDKQTDETLAEWWCILNKWQWPDSLPNPMSMNDKKNEALTDKDRGWGIMNYISGKINDKLISRTWNKDMPDDIFEVFYKGVHKGDIEAKAIYEQWLDKKVKDEMNKNEL